MNAHKIARFCEVDFDPNDWLDSSGTAVSTLTPGFDIDSGIALSMRRVDRKMRLDELDGTNVDDDI